MQIRLGVLYARKPKGWLRVYINLNERTEQAATALPADLELLSAQPADSCSE
jgi:hypothetical protein